MTSVSTKELYFVSRGISEIPQEVYDNAATLELLDLSNNQINALPEKFASLQNLKILFLTANQFKEIPDVLSRCSKLSMVSFKSNGMEEVPEDSLPESLRWLILTDNKIRKLPNSMGKLTQLRKVALAGNLLTTLPEQMQLCTKIELLRMSCNRMTELPEWLLSMPRLAWLAYAGNPFCIGTDEEKLSIPPIQSSQIQLGEIIGKGLGGSGVIFKAVWRRDSYEEQVAIKTFKGEMLSDGSPLDEMRAWASAGHHPNLLPLLGRMVDHPQYQHALVFRLLSPQYRNLAKTPNFQTCTRDVYRESETFDLNFIEQTLHGIARAAEHLHQRGLMHGDLYAHNIMVAPMHEALLTDFGAVCSYQVNDRPYAEALERLEVRAFGYLIEELVQRCQGEVPADLLAIRDQCLNEKVAERPLFKQLLEQIP